MVPTSAARQESVGEVGRPHRRWRSALINLTLVATSVAASLAVAEFGARVYENREQDASKFLSVLPVARNRLDTDIRILAVGESTVLGEPYYSKIDPVGILNHYLKATYPNHRFGHHFHGYGGAVLSNLTEGATPFLRGSPDLIVLVAGHNDFLGRWSPNSECKEDGSFKSYFGERSALARFFIARLGKSEVGQRPTVGARSFFDKPLICRAQFFDVARSYRNALEQWAVFSQKSGIPLIFIFPAANEGGYPPARSTYSAREGREEFRELYARGRLFLTIGRNEEAVSCFEEAAKYDPNFAELAYQRGKVYRHLGNSDAAQQNFQTAKENDGHPFRGLDIQRRAMRDVARQYDIPMIDFDSLLRPLSPDGILDDRLFHDAHHPSIQGYNLLGYELYRMLLASDVLKLGGKQPEKMLADAELLKAFDFGKQDWIKLLETRLKWYETTHSVSFDPSDRHRTEIALLKMAQILGPTESSAQFATKSGALVEDIRKHAKDMATGLSSPQRQIGKCNVFPIEALANDRTTVVLQELDAEKLKRQFPWFASAMGESASAHEASSAQ